MASVYFHVDLDAFFASVERRDNPQFAGKPIIVGALPGRRGVVSTCSYEARAFGVHSAMPISEAFQRCPQGIFLPVRMGRYAEVSRQVMASLRSFTPDLKQLSIDEALLDMTGTQRLWGTSKEAALKIKNKVSKELGLTVSIGIGANRYVAKVASGYRKPDGLTIVEEGEEQGFLASLPLEKLWGAGEKTRQGLASLGVFSIADLQQISEECLRAKFGKAGARFLHDAAHGQDSGIFQDEVVSHSISTERTFQRDTLDRNMVLDLLRQFSDELIARLWSERAVSYSLGIKLRYDDFSSTNRQCLRSSGYRASEEIYDDAVCLFDKHWDKNRPLRLVGMGLFNLQFKDTLQAELFDNEHDKERTTQQAILKLQEGGKGKITRARFLGDPHSKKSPS